MSDVPADEVVEIRPSTVDRLPEYEALYRTCFPHATHLTAGYLSWLYAANPAGSLVGADALVGDSVIGQVAAVPGDYVLDGRTVRGLLAVNVAVHPRYQGRHLFKKLGLRMCDFGADAGHEFVIGVANAAATPGWVRQMRFQLVQPLEARVGIGPLGIDMAAAAAARFRREWTAATIAWRMANPRNAVRCRRRRDRTACFAAAKGWALPAYAELPGEVPVAARGGLVSPARLFLGLVPEGVGGFGRYVDIPQRYRPSPLNLVYRPLGGQAASLQRGSILFSFLDFDAY